jgi:hypothetical protein
MKTQATHDTYGFKVSGLGNYEQYLKKLKIQATHDTYGFKVSGLGIYEQYLKKLLKSKDAAMAKAGREMCG